MKDYGDEIYIMGYSSIEGSNRIIFGGIGSQEWRKYEARCLFVSEKYNRIAKDIYSIKKEYGNEF